MGSITLAQVLLSAWPSQVGSVLFRKRQGGMVNYARCHSDIRLKQGCARIGKPARRVRRKQFGFEQLEYRCLMASDSIESLLLRRLARSRRQ
jgi:hypothetical protein